MNAANINDRSMVGDRDSEVDIRFEDKEMVCSTAPQQNPIIDNIISIYMILHVFLHTCCITNSRVYLYSYI